MSRQDQFMGLSNAAIKYLNDNEQLVGCCRCKCAPKPKQEVMGHYDGMFGTEYALYRHRLKDGGWGDEFVQATPWSSGPVFFLGLHVYDKNGVLRHSILWSEEEINNV